MQNGTAIPSRPWRLIAQELSKESNPKKALALATELNRALDEQLGNLPSAYNGAARDSKKVPLKP